MLSESPYFFVASGEILHFMISSRNLSSVSSPIILISPFDTPSSNGILETSSKISSFAAVWLTVLA
jgi:hypothetical protein